MSEIVTGRRFGIDVSVSSNSFETTSFTAKKRTACVRIPIYSKCSSVANSASATVSPEGIASVAVPQFIDSNNFSFGVNSLFVAAKDVGSCEEPSIKTQHFSQDSFQEALDGSLFSAKASGGEAFPKISDAKLNNHDSLNDFGSNYAVPFSSNISGIDLVLKSSSCNVNINEKHKKDKLCAGKYDSNLLSTFSTSEIENSARLNDQIDRVAIHSDTALFPRNLNGRRNRVLIEKCSDPSLTRSFSSKTNNPILANSPSDFKNLPISVLHRCSVEYSNAGAGEIEDFDYMSLTESQILIALDLSVDDSNEVIFVTNCQNLSSPQAGHRTRLSSKSESKAKKCLKSTLFETSPCQNFDDATCHQSAIDARFYCRKEYNRQNHHGDTANREVQSRGSHLHVMNRDTCTPLLSTLGDNYCKYNNNENTKESKSTKPFKQQERQRLQKYAHDSYIQDDINFSNLSGAHLQARHAEIEMNGALCQPGRGQSKCYASNRSVKIPTDPIIISHAKNHEWGNTSTSTRKNVLVNAVHLTQRLNLENKRILRKHTDKNEQTHINDALLFELASNFRCCSFETEQSDLTGLLRINKGDSIESISTIDCDNTAQKDDSSDGVKSRLTQDILFSKGITPDTSTHSDLRHVSCEIQKVKEFFGKVTFMVAAADTLRKVQEKGQETDSLCLKLLSRESKDHAFIKSQHLESCRKYRTSKTIRSTLEPILENIVCNIANIAKQEYLSEKEDTFNNHKTQRVSGMKEEWSNYQSTKSVQNEPIDSELSVLVRKLSKSDPSKELTISEKSDAQATILPLPYDIVLTESCTTRNRAVTNSDQLVQDFSIHNTEPRTTNVSDITTSTTGSTSSSFIFRASFFLRRILMQLVARRVEHLKLQSLFRWSLCANATTHTYVHREKIMNELVQQLALSRESLHVLKQHLNKKRRNKSSKNCEYVGLDRILEDPNIS